MTITLEPEAPVEASMAPVEPPVTPLPEPVAELAKEPAQQVHDLLIILYSGELEKNWAAMLLASTAGAMGMKCKVFITFWGFQSVVRDEVRITGQNWMQKMLSVMQRPGISHRKLSKMNFLGMGPWMIGYLAKKYKDANPKELMEIAQSMGVEFIPCQMTMELFGITKEDLIDGMSEPVGAATVLGLIQEGWTPLFI